MGSKKSQKWAGITCKWPLPIQVELNKKKEKGLGLSIVGKKSGPGVFISEVVKGGAADADGRLVQGDQIISVNGHDLTNSSQEEAAPVLKMAQGKIQVKWE